MAVAALAAVPAIAAGASGPTARLASRTATAAAGARTPAPPVPPHSLPGDAAAASVRADSRTWIVGARPGAAARRLAARFGARRIGGGKSGSYVVRKGRARAFAAALRTADALLFSEPNRLSRIKQGPVQDPLSAIPYDWRSKVVGPATPPPPVTPQSPLLALIDSQLDTGHREFVGSNVATLPTSPALPAHFHGTATASVAAAPSNGAGILGVWPGMRALDVPLNAEGISCADSAGGVARALDNGASVINMSYGSTEPCYAEYVQLQTAVASGVIPVAAAGNEFASGNPLEFPASLPHVLTVAATAADNSAAFFSNANAAIDLSAPGVDVEARRAGRLAGDGGHELLGADRLVGGDLGARRAPRPQRPTRSRRSCACPRSTWPAGLGPGDGLRAAQRRSRAGPGRAAVRPHRAQRRPRLGQRPRLRQARPRDLVAGRAAHASTPCSTSTRTRLTSTGSCSRAARPCG